MDMQGSEREDPVDISIVRQCIRAANDCLIEMNSQHIDLLLENFDSQSESPLFNPELEVPVLQSNHFDANVVEIVKINSGRIDSLSEIPLFKPNLKYRYHNVIIWMRMLIIVKITKSI
ncbi:hypothetical protein TNIN_355831 [Trichonephila inaurata madagascariensis]|uniref:Uncharacterized protein n=1 Tax=Trichonephila inaurata madagascariensis TaxID=2747483 RepID=A0A8X6WWK5_9ARAC|nr:hypothetical protein TNIN_355831 [Trichonephila inaurata madagascariensis]